MQFFIKKVVIVSFVFFSLICNPLFGKTRSSETFSDIVTCWRQVLETVKYEDPDFISKSQVQFDEFVKAYENYKNSNESYVNVLLNQDYTDIFRETDNVLEKLKEGVSQNDNEVVMASIKKISNLLFSLTLEETEVMAKASVANLYILASALILILLLCIFVFIIITRFEKLRKESKEMGYYSDYIIEGVQKERRRISRELHDTICQDLRVARIETELLNIPEGDSESRGKQTFIEETLTKSITDLREICNTLSPGLNKSQDTASVWQTFATSLYNFLELFQKRTSISCIIKMDPDLDSGNLSFYKTENIFGIIHEAFNNIEKHSKATNVSLLIRNDEHNQKKTILLFIIDNGIGFEKVPLIGFHFGLENMKQRANEIGANFSITSEKDDGTKIRLEIPIE